MAYKSKYYDPQKAHEYYMKHRQLKGRKKRASIADLSEEGKIAAKEVKERLQEELKAALKKVKRGNTAERKRLRELYNKKYEAELDQIRQDSSMVKPKKEKATKKSGAKSSGGGSSSGSRSGGSSAKKATTKKVKTKSQKIAETITDLKAKMPLLSDAQRVEAHKLITSLIQSYKRLLEEEKSK